MRLFLHVDADWPDTDATPVELVAIVQPTTVLVESASTIARWTEPALYGVETVPRGHQPRADVGLVFASGTDPMRIASKAVAAAVSCIRAKVPVATVRARRGITGALADRVDPIGRADDLGHDLGEVRTVLLALHKACPELQPAILQAGQAVAEALRQRSADDAARWGAVTAAWSAVEKLRIEHARIAPWLVTPDRILASWAAHLG